MAEIKQYFANAKITPDDKGTSAFNEAARRVASSYEQIAQGERESGQLLSKLWSEYKFGPDTSLEAGKGGFRVKGGIPNIMGMGGSMSGRVPYGGQPNDDGIGSTRRQMDYRAHNEISNAAPSLATLTERLISGQGLTDAQYQQLGMSRRGAALSGQGGGGIDYTKTGIQPNKDITDEEAAKAGFNVDDTDPNAPFGKVVPPYPAAQGGAGLPDILPSDPAKVTAIANDTLGPIAADQPPGAISQAVTDAANSTVGQAVGGAAYTIADNVATLGGVLPQPAGTVPPPGGTIWGAIAPLFTPSGVPAELDQKTGDDTGDPNADGGQ